MSHFCDSTVSGLTARRDNALASKCENPPLSVTPLLNVPDYTSEDLVRTRLKGVSVSDSEAWEPPQLQEKRSRSEKPILGALGEFRGILGAALGNQRLILGMQKSILGMASHNLSNAKTTTLRATPRAILEI